MATAVKRTAAEQVGERLRVDTPYWAEPYAKVLPKDRSRGLIPLVPNAAQRVLDGILEGQRAAGQPMRAIVLKARQVGISTWVQAKLMQRSLYMPYHSALVVAHETDAGAKLFAIGQRMYRGLPEDETLVLDGQERPIKPEIRGYRRTRFLHFGEPGHIGMTGDIWPDSTYWVDTAGEFESGRAGHYHALHASELAFWPQADQKFVALRPAVPDEPESLIVIESTPNGHNHFKTMWDEAWEGKTEYVPFFWPWWKQEEYTRPFVNEAERKEFRIGDVEQSPYAEEEPELVDPGPIDTLTREHVPLTLEQLNWRRFKIGSLGGKIEKFHQDYPVDPNQAFLSTGRKVFEPIFVSRAMARAEQTDPRHGDGGPIVGAITAGKYETEEGRFGEVSVPREPAFKPARELGIAEDADWRLWLPTEDGKPVVPKDRAYVIGGDVSEGLPESDDETADPAYHALQVIDHRSREQVAEYRSRCDPDELAVHAMLAAVLFNWAWLAIERTGPGRTVVRKLRHDFHYPYMYRLRRHATESEKQGVEFGWETNRKTKPILLAGGQELLREGTHGIRSRRTVAEMQTYIKLSTGKSLPERGKFADLLMAWLVAQQVAEELPVLDGQEEPDEAPSSGVVRTWKPRNPKTGY